MLSIKHNGKIVRKRHEPFLSTPRWSHRAFSAACRYRKALLPLLKYSAYCDDYDLAIEDFLVLMMLTLFVIRYHHINIIIIYDSRLVAVCVFIFNDFVHEKGTFTSLSHMVFHMNMDTNNNPHNPCVDEACRKSICMLFHDWTQSIQQTSSISKNTSFEKSQAHHPFTEATKSTVML